jgi:hypothetical protein
LPVLNGWLLAEGVKQFAVAGEKAGSVGPYCSPFLAQAELHCEPVQLQAKQEYIITDCKSQWFISNYIIFNSKQLEIKYLQLLENTYLT